MKILAASLLSLFLLHNPCGSALSAYEPVPMQSGQPAQMISSGQLPWVDYASAVQQAKTTGQGIVLLFTGTDWCPWCKVLEKDVLNAPGFAETLQNNFLFVRLDFPRTFALPPAVTQENNSLRDRFKITRYPTLVILDAEGRTLGTTGYPKGSPTQFATELQNLRAASRK